MQHANGFSSADIKVKGGKLLRVRLRAEHEPHGVPYIVELAVTGDFFMHPEEALDILEQALLGAPLTVEGLRPRIAAFFAADVQVIGANVDDFVQLLLAAK